MCDSSTGANASSNTDPSVFIANRGTIEIFADGDLAFRNFWVIQRSGSLCGSEMAQLRPMARYDTVLYVSTNFAANACTSSFRHSLNDSLYSLPMLALCWFTVMYMPFSYLTSHPSGIWIDLSIFDPSGIILPLTKSL